MSADDSFSALSLPIKDLDLKESSKEFPVQLKRQYRNRQTESCDSPVLTARSDAPGSVTSTPRSARSQRAHVAPVFDQDEAAFYRFQKDRESYFYIPRRSRAFMSTQTQPPFGTDDSDHTRRPPNTASFEMSSWEGKKKTVGYMQSLQRVNTAPIDQLKSVGDIGSGGEASQPSSPAQHGFMQRKKRIPKSTESPLPRGDFPQGSAETPRSMSPTSMATGYTESVLSFHGVQDIVPGRMDRETAKAARSFGMTPKEAERHRCGYIQGKMRLHMPSEIAMAGLLTDRPLPPSVDLPYGPVKGEAGSPTSLISAGVGSAIFTAVRDGTNALVVEHAPIDTAAGNTDHTQAHEGSSARPPRSEHIAPTAPTAVAESATSTVRSSAVKSAKGNASGTSTPVSGRFRVFRSFSSEVMQAVAAIAAAQRAEEK